jgi:uncharacterized cofD-like protein
MSGARTGDRPRVVAIGGGHGLARGLTALRLLAVEPTAVVTVADDGGSSGRLRADLDIIAPGDLRMALLALARNERLVAALGHRFGRGELEGHALGNLLLVALAERAGGDFVAALDEAAALLDCAGRVLPSTESAVTLHAQIGDQQVAGQVAIARARARVERVWVEPAAATGCKEAVAAIGAADVVVLGPGSLFTSIIATLAVSEVGAALRESQARVVYVANVSTQPGETSGLDAQRHVEALLQHVPGLHLHGVVLHDGPPSFGAGAGLGTALDHRDVGAVVCADVLARDPGGAPAYGHDPERLAAALAPLLGLQPPRR